jgi:glycosyltransferase involved in cell wall biosynthesis
MVNLILIVDPRNLILGNPSTLKRHLFYAEALSNLTDKSFKLGVITIHSRNDDLIEPIEHLYSIKVPKSILFRHRTLKSFIRHFKEMFRTQLLVAGDPWESFLASVMFSKMIRSSLRIQVQVHGDIGNRLWISHNWRNRIRSVVSFATLRFATEIRATSDLQANLLSKSYRVDRKKIRVIPVPSFYLYDDSVTNSTPVRPKSLGLVGRIEHDRGLDSFVELTVKLAKVNPDFSVVVVGSGNLRSKLEKDLEQHLPLNRIAFTGELDPANMQVAWNLVGVLVSCAPAESYGRVMRESLANGVPVWATPSSGSIELFQSAGHGMKILDLSDSPEVLNRIFEQLLVYEVDEKVRKQLIDKDRELIPKLLLSWVSSINKSEII